MNLAKLKKWIDYAKNKKFFESDSGFENINPDDVLNDWIKYLESRTPEERKKDQEEHLKWLKRERNTTIIGWVALLSFVFALLLPENFGGIVAIISYITGINWLWRRDYIFYARKDKSIK